MEKEFEYLKPLQKLQTKMLKDLADFCGKHQIEWSLCYGSVLGAIRHNGPIPWDDDVDTFMLAEDYEKFREAFNKNGDKNRYYLQERVNYNGFIDFAKIRLNNTTYIEDGIKDMNMHHGIFIDIFILHKAPKRRLAKKWGSFVSTYLQLKIMSNQNYKKRKKFIPLMKALKILPKTFGMKYSLKYRYRYDKKDFDDYVIWTIHPKFINKNIIYPYKYVKYGEYRFPVPNDYEEYLRINYGDWEKIPSIESIMWEQHSSIWDCDKDFRYYLPNVNSYCDELKIK